LGAAFFAAEITRDGGFISGESPMDMSNVALIVEAVVVVLGTAGAIGWYVARRASNKSGAADVRQSASSEGSSVGSSAAKYHPVHVLIHWFIAFAMAQLLLRGAFIMVNIPNTSPEKISALRAHMFAGSLVLVLMIVRLVLVNTTRLPAPAKGPTPLFTRLKEMVHPLLYASIFVQAFAGLGMAYQADLPSVIFLPSRCIAGEFLDLSAQNGSLRQFTDIDELNCAAYKRRPVSYFYQEGRIASPHELWPALARRARRESSN
jgi:cytochrome b561